MMTLESLKNEIPDTVILSLDVSQERTGWALLKGCQLEGFGYITRPEIFNKVTFKMSEFSNLLYWYYDEVNGLIADIINSPSFKTTIINSIVMEDMNMKFRFNAGKILMQFQAAAKIACANHGYKVHLINNATVKSMFKIQKRKKLFSEELKAKAKENKVTEVKIQMVDTVNKLWGKNFTYEQNDECDAIAQGFTFLVKEAQNV